MFFLWHWRNYACLSNRCCISFAFSSHHLFYMSRVLLWASALACWWASFFCLELVSFCHAQKVLRFRSISSSISRSFSSNQSWCFLVENPSVFSQVLIMLDLRVLQAPSTVFLSCWLFIRSSLRHWRKRFRLIGSLSPSTLIFRRHCFCCSLRLGASLTDMIERMSWWSVQQSSAPVRARVMQTSLRSRVRTTT